MNKKFSTLLASAMLLTAFSAGAQKKGEAAMLKLSSSDYLLVENTTNGAGGKVFGQLQSATEPGTPYFSLAKLNQATWTVSDVKTVLGQSVYSFVNKATGLPFAVDATLAVDYKGGAGATAGTALTVGAGNVSEWVVESGKLVSYFSQKSDSVYYLAKNTADNTIFLKKGTKANATTNDTDALGVTIYQDFDNYKAMKLKAADLNTLLQSNALSQYFGLSMTPEVSKGQENLLTATSLIAKDVASTGYVTLQAKGKQVTDKQGKKHDAFVVVDTAYYPGTESDGLLKFAYDKAAATGREAGSYEYAFTFDAKAQKLYVQVKKAVHQYVAKKDATAAELKSIKQGLNNTYWPAADVTLGSTTPVLTNLTARRAIVENEYIYMAQLAGTNVLTVNVPEAASTSPAGFEQFDKGTRKTGSRTAGDIATNGKDQNVVIKIATAFKGLTMTTIPDGVYTVQYNGKKGAENFEYNGAYALDNLAGTFGKAFQAKRQNFNHMPAAQWVVEKQGTTNIAPVKITNREFLNDLGNNNPAAVHQFYAVEGDATKVFYFDGVGTPDTLTFTKVADSLVKDLKLGYKYVSEDSAKVQTYSFNYLHGLSLDKFLYTPEGKDSIVRVDENDGKSAFRLEIVVKDDKYGIGDSLVRNVYYVKRADGKYISYDKINKKYMMMAKPTPFFLKENNCIDGKHYYSLVEAEFRHFEVASTTDLATYYDAAGNKFTPDHKFVKNYAGKYYFPAFSGNQPIVADGSSFSEIDYYTKPATDLVKGTHKAASVSFNLWSFVYSNEAPQAYNYSSTSKAMPTNRYASVKVSVNDNTLDLEEGNLNDKFTTGELNEIRTSAFAVEVYDVPLYRRFNNPNRGESTTDAVDTLSFYESVRGEYLMDEWNNNLKDSVVDYAGIWNKEKANGKLNFIVDTAWVNRGLGFIKPQYLISVARNDQDSIKGIPCTYEHNHYDNAGNKVDAAHCSHATQGRPGFHYGKYLVSFADSAAKYASNVKAQAPYLATTGGYTRVGFVKAIHYGDSLYILTRGFENVEPAKLNVDEIIKAYTKDGVNTTYIVNLRNDNHKNVTWSFRYVTPSVEARTTSVEGPVNSFLVESNIYNKEAARDNEAYIPAGNDKLGTGSIAPEYAAWLKLQNGCLVLTRGDSKFASAKTSSDYALIFNVNQKGAEEDMVTDNEEVAVEGVQVVAGNGVVTVLGAAGQKVQISTVLGKTVAAQTLTSDNASIACPAGVVFVTVNGETTKVVVK